MGSQRCHIYDKEANVRGSCTTKVVPLYPEVGYVEMDPDAIFEGFITVVKRSLQMRQIDDRRAADLVKSWNRCCTMKVSLLLQKRALAASLIVFSTQHVTFRLVWALTHYKQVRQAVAEGNCCFGTVDTWLLFKLTKGQVHATDYSNAEFNRNFRLLSGLMCWSGFLSFLVSLPLSIFPKVENTNHDFGSTDPSIFGESIPIMSVMADQQAAMFGECCFDVGDVKITMGTGTFMDINTGSQPHMPVAGLYPLVGWKIGSEVVYLAEGNAADTGTAIKWAQDSSLNVQETSDMAYSVSDSDGVCFVPSFSGLQVDPCASLMGLKPSTTKSHLVRAILESVAFSNKQLYETILRETSIPITKIRVDGGVSSNDFVMQMTADLFGRKVARPQHYEMSSLGAAFVAGLGIGMQGRAEEAGRAPTNRSRPKEHPRAALAARVGNTSRASRDWERALRRSMNWYQALTRMHTTRRS
uniref:Glycerol kinase 5 n=1 Tax=Cyclopterus lumpus TaxID=8103 RepID=A0A8C2XEG7_CYCLU